jgi:flagellar motor switch protein FliN
MNIQVPPDELQGEPLAPLGAAIFKDIQVELDAKLGRTVLSVEALTNLRAGSVVTLDLGLNDLVELRLNGSIVARGEIVAVDDHFGVRIVEIAAVE